MALSNKLKVNEFINLMVNYATSKVGKNQDRYISPKDVNPIMLWGSPGVGKSQAMRQVGEVLGKKLNKKVEITDVRLLLFSPTDLRGIPVADAKKELAIWLRPKIFQMDSSEEILNILILDEISAAPPSVQAAAYQIVLDRQVGEHRIPDNCIIMAAGNRVTDKSVAYKMPKALGNRLCHINIEIDVDDWKRWAIPNDIDSTILAYVNTDPIKLDKFDHSTDDNAFATPRAWEKVDGVLKILGLENGMPLISGLIGEALAYDFMTYTKVFEDIPNIDHILQGKGAKAPTRPDINFALVSALVSRVFKVNDEELDNILRYALDKMGADFAVLVYKDLVKAGDEAKNRILKSKVLPDFISKYGSILSDSIKEN